MYRKRHEIIHISGCIHLVDKVSLEFRTQKNGSKNATVTQWKTGKHLDPVQVLDDIITRLESHPRTSYDTPVKEVWVDNHKADTTHQMTIKLLRSGIISFGEELIGFSHK